MALKVKNDDKDELSVDKDTKFKSYHQTIQEVHPRMQMSRQVTRIVNNLDSLSSSPRTKASENSKMLDKVIMFLSGQSATDVKDMNT